MKFKIEILDTKNLPEAQWVLCKGNLMDYLESLKPSFYEYIIQRKIVKNRYLNTIVNTVLGSEPLPIITLTSTVRIENPNKGMVTSIDMEQVEILDGLQRTFRLWAYSQIIQEFKKKKNLSPIDFSKAIKINYPEFFDSGIINLTKVKTYYNDDTFAKIETAFRDFDVYFFLWNGLTPGKVIHKMLVLNAGQRPVSLAHQYELLFLYVWEEVKSTAGITLYRERDTNANTIKKGERQVGEYMFSSVIAGLRSYLENKPKRLSVDDLDIEDLQSAETSSQNINEDVFSKPYIELFLTRLKEVDQSVFDKEKEDGKKWFVRDTTISGLLAGLGKYIGVRESMPISEIQQITTRAFDILTARILQHGLALDQFQKEYYNLQSRTVNVGTFVRSIIMEYTIQLLNNTNPSWKSLFEKSKS